MTERKLEGQVAIVAGATRGLGRAIAVTLGAAGATVYCTGRSVKGHLSDIGRQETVDETAAMASEAGGRGIAVRVDHTEEPQVRALFERIADEQGGRLDIAVNDIWGGESLTQWGVPFWEHDLGKGLAMQKRAVWSHLITARYAAPLLAARKSGLMAEITDGWDYRYRGSLYYSLAKISAIHLAQGMAADLKPHGVTSVAVTPGFLRSEEMLDYFGVTEANWRDAAAKDPHFLQSETPYYAARGLAALAADPNGHAKSGGVYTSWGLSDDYGIEDLDGRRPHWGRYSEEQGL